jgi:predicted P-loop ATPase
METLIQDLGLPKQLDLAQLSEVLNTHFLFEEERELLYLKKDTSCYATVNDFEIMLSRQGVVITGRNSLKTALRSTSLERRRWIPHVFETLPVWDKVDRIRQLSECFGLVNKEQAEIHRKVLQFWFVKAADMAMKPDDINAVNRLVLTYQSDAQGIGKTTFARWLAEPFKMDSKPSIKELDYPDTSKDTMIEFGKNLIALLDDINSWDAKSIKRYKGVISSKTINARLPYAAHSSYLPRTASFIATTNESGFLNENGNTRWAIINLTSIDFKYTKLDQLQLWAQAKELALCNTELYESEVRKYSIESAEQHNVVTELDEIVRHWYELDPNGASRATVLFEQLPIQEQQYFGYKGSALSKFTKSIQRVFGDADVYFKSSGRGKWRLKISPERWLDQ